MSNAGNVPSRDDLTPFSRLLVVCAPDAKGAETLAFAAGLARKHGAAMTVLSVLEPPGELDQIARAAGVPAPEITGRLVAERGDAMARMLAQAGVEADLEVAAGKRFIEIIAHAIASGADLVIKAAEPLGGISGFLFASTDQHLLRKCPVPVWLRCDSNQAAPSRIVAAVDVNETLADEPDTLSGLNLRILETAMRIAAGGSADIHVIHAWDAPGEALVQLWSDAGIAN